MDYRKLEKTIELEILDFINMAKLDLSDIDHAESVLNDTFYSEAMENYLEETGLSLGFEMTYFDVVNGKPVVEVTVWEW